MRFSSPNIMKLMFRNIKVNTDPGTLLFLVGLPAMYLIFFGYGFQSFTAPGSNPKVILRFMAPGIAAFQAVIAGQVAGGMLWSDKRWGMLAQMLVGPFTRLEYLMGIMLTCVVLGLTGAGVMFAVAYLLIGATPITVAGVFLVVSAALIGSLLFGSMTLILSAFIKSSTAYNSITILILFVVNFASTVFYPFSSSYPLPLQALFIINPLTYVANTVRDGYNASIGFNDVTNLFLLLIGTVILLFVAIWAYRRSDISFV
jgi:ABC-2 type transport system permease protein